MKSLLQTQDWAALRESQGWRVHWVEEILILEKPLSMGLSFLYAPEVDFYQTEFQKNLAKIKEIAKNSHSIFVRFDFLNKIDPIYSQKITKILKDFHFIKAFEEIQPEFRQMIDISRSEEQILAQMKQKGRYNIKVAQKHGVEIVRLPRPSTSSDLAMTDGIDDFYQIFRETAERDGFEVRPKKYFEKLLEVLGDKTILLVARYQNKVLAAAIIGLYDETASYLYGASSSENRETMAPYLLHWEAIREAKRRNCKIYDLLAIEPFDTRNKIQETRYKHKYSGITRFKEQFGGQKIQLVGSWDLILKPGWYKMFKIAEKTRRH